MDEPFSALDIAMKTELIQLLKGVFTQLNATVWIVSHNPQELEGLVDDEMYIGE